MFLYLGGVWMPPHLYTPYICMPPVHLYTPQGCTYPHRPPCFLCTCIVLEHLHVVGGCYLLNCVLGHLPYTTLSGGASPLITPPHSIVDSLCIAILRDISILCGPFPSLEGFGGVPHHLGRFGGHISSSAVHILILVHFL